MCGFDDLPACIDGDFLDRVAVDTGTHITRLITEQVNRLQTQLTPSQIEILREIEENYSALIGSIEVAVASAVVKRMRSCR